MSNKAKINQAGLVSILVTLIMMIVISLIVLGFSEVSRRNSREALDRQLSTQAFYAAETGVNDALTAVKAGPSAPNGVDPDAPSSSSFNSVCSGAGSLISTLAAKGYNNQLSAASNVSYSCVLLNNKPNSVIVTVPLGSAKVVPLLLGNSNSTLVFTWPAAASGGNLASCPASATVFVPSPSWGCSFGILRADIYNANGPLDPITMANNTATVYMVPHSGGAGTQAISFGPNPPYAMSANCNATQCQATLNIGAATNMYARLSSIYSEVGKVQISAGPTTTFADAQLLIDATGKAQDVLRRIQVRVPLTDDDGIAVPINALQSPNGICKRFDILPGGTANPDYDAAVTPTTGPLCAN